MSRGVQAEKTKYRYFKNILTVYTSNTAVFGITRSDAFVQHNIYYYFILY